MAGCLTCSDNSSCSACDESNQYFLGMSSNICILCPAGQTLEPAAEVCFDCSTECQSCALNQPNDCTACPAGKVIQGDVGSRTCVEESQQGCNASCASCDTNFPNQCTTCPSGKCLSNSQLCTDCPPTTFTPPEDTNENIVVRSTLTYNVYQFDINDPKIYKITFSE
jgi:hypothetical protein